MTNNDATPAPICTTAIRVEDFSQYTDDAMRHRWTIAKMRAVIAALKGQPVALVLDNQTGFALAGVRLTDVFDGGPSRGLRLRVESDDADGVTRPTNYRLAATGNTIIPLAPESGVRGAKWDAVEAYREAQRNGGERELRPTKVRLG